MTTDPFGERSGPLPGDAQIAMGEAPKPTHSQALPSASPGLSLASVTPLAGPTLPDWDPASLSLVVSRYANELFSAPPVSPEPARPTPVSPSIPSAPAMIEPATDVALSGQPSTPISPFSATPSFDRIGGPAAPQYEPVALLDVPAPGSIPVESSADPAPLPYWVPSASAPVTEPPKTEAVAAPFQIEPVSRIEEYNGSRPLFDPYAIRREFPILNERVNGKRLVWLDNAATTQKPQSVIDRVKYFYEHENSNIHRAAHTLAARATDAYESARETVRRVINAPTKNEIIFVRGTTEGINLVSQSWGRRNVREGDEIVLTHLEHHANIVPWQLLASEKGAKIRVAPVDDTGQVILAEYEKLLNERTKIVAFPQVSNALGTITPALEMTRLAHRYGAKVMLDGAQGISHMPVDVQALDCDFYVFSGHKVFAPTGIGAVFGKADILEAMPPWQGGGNMIQDVTFEKTIYQGPPARFEAGTGNIADAVGLGAALDWLSRVGLENVGAYEHELLVYATERLATVPGLRMIGTAPDKAGVLSFTLAGQKTEEVGGILDQEGIAVRSGHHCAQPILRRFGVEATVRASLAPYNCREDIDALVSALLRLQAGQLARARA
jgi:cysteine desulfurase/selenocysteine lyase